jgi:hypothetical protein
MLSQSKHGAGFFNGPTSAARNVARYAALTVLSGGVSVVACCCAD